MGNSSTTSSYNKNDRQSIVEYASMLIGSTLRESTDAEEIADIKRSKGSFGEAVEYYYFDLKNNSDSAPDFKEACIELKTTPLKRSKGGALSAKERLVLGMINYMTVVDETFETSHLMEKAETVGSSWPTMDIKYRRILLAWLITNGRQGKTTRLGTQGFVYDSHVEPHS